MERQSSILVALAANSKICCRVAGAYRGIGVELPDNKAQKYIFDAACKRIEQALSVHLHDLEWNAQDINQVLEN
jgi:hypothetical protein